jgi:choline monooxygenase
MSPFFVDPDISLANTISTEVYTSPAVFEASKEKIFAASWQFVGDKNFVQNNGDVFPFILLENYLGEPLVLTKNATGNIHCLSNVCTHRGNLVAYEPCRNTSHLRCKYHGRLFELNGKFISMPEFKEVKNFPCAADDLPVLPLFNWGNLLFSNLDASAKTDPYFKAMMERLHWLPLQEFIYRPELNKTFELDANWALYCENYLEGFHIPFVHAALNAELDYGEYSTELFELSNLQLGVGKGAGDCFDLPTSSIDHGKNISAYYFWVYPNMMFNFYPWGLSVNIVQPLAVNKTRVQFLTYMWKQEKYNMGAGSELDKVELEDEAIVINVQKGIRSRFYKHGRYSVKRETGTHHFHRLLAASLNG